MVKSYEVLLSLEYNLYLWVLEPNLPCIPGDVIESLSWALNLINLESLSCLDDNKEGLLLLWTKEAFGDQDVLLLTEIEQVDSIIIIHKGI